MPAEDDLLLHPGAPEAPPADAPRGAGHFDARRKFVAAAAAAVAVGTVAGLSGRRAAPQPSVHAAVAVGGSPRLLREVPVPTGSWGHFDHLSVSGGVAFIASKDNTSTGAAGAGGVAAVRYAGLPPLGILDVYRPPGCNPQGVATLAPGLIATGCGGTGEVLVLEWDGAALRPAATATAPAGDADDVKRVNASAFAVGYGDGPASGFAVFAREAGALRMRASVPLPNHPEGYAWLRDDVWGVNVPTLSLLYIVSMGAGGGRVLRTWNTATASCPFGAFPMVTFSRGGAHYVVTACGKHGPKGGSAPVVVIWDMADLLVGVGGGIPAPVCTLPAHDDMDDLHFTASGLMLASAGGRWTEGGMGYLSAYEQAPGACPLRLRWSVATSTASRTCAVDDERGLVIVLSPPCGVFASPPCTLGANSSAPMLRVFAL